MFRYFFHIEDKSEYLIETLYFNTDRFYLSLKRGHQRVFTGSSLEALIASIKTSDYAEKDELIKSVNQTFRNQRKEFNKFLKDIDVKFKQHLVWRQKNTASPSPLGVGYVFNPSDPKKGKKNTMLAKSNSNTDETPHCN